MMLRDEKISRAKAKLLVDYPFFGTLASRLEVVLNDDIQAFKNDGITLEYNSDFMQDITPAELEFVLANGAMHASMAYENRQGERSNWLWQLSSEYAINDILVQSGLERPYQAHYSERFINLYTEEIYAELKADIIRDAKELPESEGDDVDSRVKPENDEKSTSGNLDEELFKEFSHSILEKEDKDAPIYELLKRFFNLEKESKYDWRDELRDAIDRFAKDDYAQMPPNKKFLSQGIYLPSLTSETFNLVIAIDSSGSIDDELLSEFLSEVNSLILSIIKYKIDILVCDYKVRSHKTFYGGDTLELSLEGGGATDFRPVFEFIDENLFDTKLLIYFTDLDGTFPKVMPNYEVKWISAYSKTI